ncbi:MAG: hypothetical protein QW548_00875 [Candidatus Aenigmatarchaeota archaeon]
MKRYAPRCDWKLEYLTGNTAPGRADGYDAKTRELFDYVRGHKEEFFGPGEVVGPVVIPDLHFPKSRELTAVEFVLLGAKEGAVVKLDADSNARNRKRKRAALRAAQQFLSGKFSQPFRAYVLGMEGGKPWHYEVLPEDREGVSYERKPLLKKIGG